MKPCHHQSRRAVIAAIRTNHLKMSLRELAAALEVSHGYLSRIESGERTCSDAVWQRFRNHVQSTLKGDVQAIFTSLCEGGR